MVGNAISEFQKLSLSKQGQVQNLCCENELHLHENEKSFSHQWLCTEPCLETEACANFENKPQGLYFSKVLFEGLYSEGLIMYRGKFAFQNRLG